MRHFMAKFWWIFVFRGVLGILLGLEVLWLMLSPQWNFEDNFAIAALLKPALALVMIIFLLVFYSLFDGIFAVILGAQDYGHGRRWWALVAEGVFSIGLGLLALLKPGVAILILLYWIAGWAILTGFLEMGQGLRGTEYRDRRQPLFYAGLFSVVFGLLVFLVSPGGVGIIWLIGLYSFLVAIPFLALGFHMRRFA